MAGLRIFHLALGILKYLHKYTNTQLHKFANTHTNTQILKFLGFFFSCGRPLNI